MQAFKHDTEEKSATKGGCMYFIFYLERYTRGYTQDILQSLHMIPERGFGTAETLIQKHFGNKKAHSGLHGKSSRLTCR